MSSADTAAKVRVQDLCFHLLILFSCFNRTRIKFKLDVQGSLKNIMITYFVALQDMLDVLIVFGFIDFLTDENCQKCLLVFYNSLNFYTFCSFHTIASFFLFCVFFL